MSFGGAVKLTGESEYKKALNEINRSLREVTAEMKATSAQFSATDKSLDATKQKTEALTKVQGEQEKKLQTLKTQYAAMSKEYSDQTAKHEKLVSTYDKEKAELDRLAKTVGTTSKEYQDQKSKVESLSQEVTKSTKAQDANAKSMSDMRVQIANAQGDINKTTRAIDDLGEETEETGKQAEKASNGGFTVMKGVLADLAASAIKAALNGLKQLGGAFIDIGKQAYNNYAQYEQLVGGVETLFGESADELIKYADVAYKTAGMSANEYMEQATSFSATLLQGLGGDTAKAVEYANMAIIDMSDNANKMGTNMTMIQNAYNGFAKQNYTMLDNLKLGYGGTQAEMARLINDSGVLGDSIEVTAETVKDVPFDKVIEAIHVIQTNIGITGTTTAEALGTIEGSTKTMSAAWQNLLTGMADDTADFDGLIKNFVDSVLAVASNMLPRIKTIISGMGKVISELLRTLVPELVKMIPLLLEETLPTLIEAVNNLIKAVLDVVPQIIPLIVEMIPQIVAAILEMTPLLIDAGIKLLMGLIQGITDTIPVLIEMLPTIIDSIVSLITDNLPLIVDTGIALLLALVDGIVKAVPTLIAKIPEIITSILKTITEELPKILDAGMEILNALIEGITEAIPALVKMLPDIITTTISTLVGMLPQIIETGLQMLMALIDGIIEALPELIEMLPTIIETTVDVLLDNLPLIIDAGFKILIGLINGILKALPDLIVAIPKIIVTIVTTLTNNLPKIFKMGKDILSELGKGIVNTIGTLVSKIGTEVIPKVIKKFGELPENIVDVGKNLVKGLWNGIKDMTGWVIDKIKGFGGDILGGIKNFFGIKSPSKLFEDQVGKYLAEGIGVGFEDEMKDVTKQMQDSIPTSFDVDSTINTSGGAVTNTFDGMVLAFKEALAQMKVELNDEEMGKFVDTTVTRLVYS